MACSAEGAGGLRPDERALLAPGDLILIGGRDLPADLIRWALAEAVPLSHIGVLWPGPGAPEGPDWWVYHTANLGVVPLEPGDGQPGSGLRRQSLDWFLSRAAPDTVLVQRPRWPGAGGGQEPAAVSPAAFGAVLARWWSEGRPFDNLYDLATDLDLYCSELVSKALDAAGFWSAGPQLKLRQGLITFATFLEPAWFEPVLSRHPAWP